jgi:hypothetical protein
MRRRNYFVEAPFVEAFAAPSPFTKSHSRRCDTRRAAAI